jgi:nucleoside-diphosphate kinase
MHSQQTGELLHAITSDGRFQINAIFSIHMTLAMAEELFEVYRGLFLSYTAMLEHMCSTPVLAVMISGTGAGADYDDVVSSFREFVGPSEPALAKVLRPESIRYSFAALFSLRLFQWHHRWFLVVDFCIRAPYNQMF